MSEMDEYELAGRLTRERDEGRTEIASLRAELATLRKRYGDALEERDIAVAAARQDAEDRAADIEAAEKRGYDCGVNDIVRQDAEEKARLKKALEPFAVMAEAFKPLSENKCVSVHPTVGDLRRAALACRLQGEKS